MCRSFCFFWSLVMRHQSESKSRHAAVNRFPSARTFKETRRLQIFLQQTRKLNETRQRAALCTIATEHFRSLRWASRCTADIPAPSLLLNNHGWGEGEGRAWHSFKCWEQKEETEASLSCKTSSHSLFRPQELCSPTVIADIEHSMCCLLISAHLQTPHSVIFICYA